VNTGAPWPTLSMDEAQARVLGIQTKLHQWATGDPARRFDDLFNLVCDPAFVLVAWRRVRGNKGARTAGVDGQTARYIERERGEEAFLADVRAELKARRFAPLPVRERQIPKPGGRLRRLGIATIQDRVVQAALKLVLEPIFEADFVPCSYGFRPGRRAQDAIEEVRYLAARSYEWVLEADITACFDEIDHAALLARVRRRVGDKRVLALVKAFLTAGILGEDGVERDTSSGTPQGGILSPLLSNIALSVLDEHFAKAWQAMGTASQRHARRKRGEATWRLVRYADDFVVMVAGTHAHAQALRDEVAGVLATMSLRLSEAKTRVCHIDEGMDFLGWRIQRHQQRGSTRRYVYTYPSKKALAVVKAKVRTLTKGMRNQPLRVLLHRLNWVLPGLDHLLPPRVLLGNLRLPARVHLAASGQLAASKAPGDQLEGAAPPLPARVVADAGHRDDGQPCRGRDRPLPLPGRQDPHAMDQQPEGNDQVTPPELVESPLRGNAHGGFGGAGRRNGPSRKQDTALRPDPTTTATPTVPTYAGEGSPRGSLGGRSSRRPGLGATAGRSSGHCRG
jgi:RNA-directed DNA polymerase